MFRTVYKTSLCKSLYYELCCVYAYNDGGYETEYTTSKAETNGVTAFGETYLDNALHVLGMTEAKRYLTIRSQEQDVITMPGDPWME